MKAIYFSKDEFTLLSLLFLTKIIKITLHYIQLDLALETHGKKCR